MDGKEELFGTFVVPLGALRRGDANRMGGKAANLGELMAAGLPVPAGFCVTTDAFDAFRAAKGNGVDWTRFLSLKSGMERRQIAAASHRAQASLEQIIMPASVQEAILTAWRGMGSGITVAVRSSATVEDAPGQSFAGQFETVLGVQDADALLRAIRQCWSSLYSERALMYQVQRGVSVGQTSMAVVVQRMIDAEWSGVVFTADPITGASDRLAVEYVRGLGDGLVQGTVQPERITILRDTVQRGGSGAASAHLPVAVSAKLMECALACEALFGLPQDIEWSLCGTEIWLLQARPITAAGAKLKSWEDRQVWTNLNAGEVLPDVISPMTWSLIQNLLGPLSQSISHLAGVDFNITTFVGLVAGRVYVNINAGLAAMKPFAGLLEYIPQVALALGGGDLEESRRLLRSIPDEDLPELGFSWPRYIFSWPRVVIDLLRHSPRQGDRWILELKARADALARIDPEALSTPDLAQFVHRLLRKGFEGWDLLYLGTQAVALPIFQRACQVWLQDPTLSLGYRLFSGLGGVPEAEAGLALWRLAVLAHSEPETLSIISKASDWREAHARLQAADHGREFLKAWNAFMVEHGHHCRGELELFNARWSETPDYILGQVRGYLRSIEGSDPLETRRRLARERDELTDECCGRLRNPMKRWLFRWSLRRAQKLAVNREQWKNAAVRQIATLRRALLELGQRLANQGKLPDANAIFFLEIAELEALTGEEVSFDPRERVRQRREERARNAALHPPAIVKGRYDPQPQPTPQVEPNGNVLIGIPVSPGVARGRAKVILRNDSEAQVLSGEILVAPYTDPAWTPYFVAAAGVVVEQGGVLSHGSIVAREYGLPAVTNVASATRLIQTGDLLQVDGNSGRVTVLK